MSDAFIKAVSAGLFTVLAACSASIAQAAKLATTAFAHSDHDGNGVADVEEYRARMIGVFVALNADGNGYLVIAEVSDANKDVFLAADINGNDKVSVRGVPPWSCRGSGRPTMTAIMCCHSRRSARWTAKRRAATDDAMTVPC